MRILLFYLWLYLLFICVWANERTQYELKLVASDSLNENQTTIVISVRDVNDLPPVFPQTLYERSLNEELAAPFTIIQVAILLYIHMYQSKHCISYAYIV